MQLTLRLLDDVQTVNSWEAVTEISVIAGDPQEIYVQLLDARKKACPSDGPMRYMPAAGAELEVVLDSIDADKKVTKAASQPFANDASIWRIQLTAIESAKLAGTVNLVFSLTEGTRVASGRLMARVLVS